MNLDDLISIRSANPDLPVRFMLPTDMDDDYPYYSGEITEVKVDSVWNCTHREMIIIGKDNIMDELYCQIERPDENSDDVLDAKYDEMVSSGIINTEIIVTMECEHNA